MPGHGKRIANVPRDAVRLAEDVSKSDLLEAAWFLAALCNDSGADDEEATFTRLYDELNTLRANRGVRALPPIGQLRAKWHAERERHQKMVEGWQKKPA